MTGSNFSRRGFLVGAATVAAASALPLRPARAAKSMVAAVYPQTWEQAYRQHVVPHMKNTAGIDVVLSPLLAFDQVSKTTAARGNPEFDILLLDPGPHLTAIETGLVQAIDPSKIPNWGKLFARFQDKMGPAVAVQVVGLVYNPKKVDKPTGWKDLFSPKYHGKVGLTGFNTTFGTAAMVEIAKAYGGSESNVEPAFEQVQKLLPNVGAVAQNPAQLAALYQQGEIDLYYTNTNNVAVLKGKGLDIDFVQPDTGAVAFGTTMLIPKGARNVEEAHAYINAALSTEMQSELQNPPYDLIPTNREVKLAPAIGGLIGSHDNLDKFVYQDWTVINKQRRGWIERFNKEVRA